MSDLHPTDGAGTGPAAASSAPASRWRRHRVGAILWSIVILLAVGTVVVERLVPRPAEKKVEVHLKAVSVRTMPARADGFADVLELPGRIEPRVAATLAAEKPGRIVGVTVDRGDRVKAGQVLVHLDRDAWEARLRQAEVEQREAVRDLARIGDLQKTGAVSQSDLDAAVARRDRAAAGLSDAKAQVRQCEVVSPIDGEVTDRFVETGEHAAEGGAVIRVVDIATVKIVFDLPERAVGDLAVGQPVTFTVDGLGRGAWTAAVTFVSSEAEARSNTYRVEARLPNPGRTLRAGMLSRVRIERPVAPGHVAVPLAAVIPRRGEHVVFVAKDGHAVRRVVTLDRITGTMAVVSAGIAAGEAVIVDGHRGLSDGASIDAAAGGEPALPGAGA